MTNPAKRNERVPEREPWHYDAFEGRPEWSKELGKQRALQRQQENVTIKDRKRVAA